MKKETITTIIMSSVLLIGAVVTMTGCGGTSVSRNEIPNQIKSMEMGNYCLGCYSKSNTNCFGCNESSFYGCINCFSIRGCDSDVDVEYDTSSSNCTLGFGDVGITANCSAPFACSIDDSKYYYKADGPSCGGCYCVTINSYGEDQGCVGQGCYK
ncbi:MAG: hypothetical protein NC452_17790 [Eubacterium sp.]|nr:hypothetical protein [Eubacterium sp.]